ncbi:MULTISPECIES: YlbF family regulator [unclassified Gemella]|uniref:YlbF family regulator n=1 Tax=unclassified Gemella TaxID=2624949 RepID=UPI0015D03B0D|nr:MULTISPECIES: YlbF family regulator [unclassified Gemella]MBF0709694.1 YlbF family regulator [Gemella sp. GL1.1]NYS27038.1 YlbF family regulator [Gemella sp. GL1]
MTKLYDKANELERALRDDENYTAVEKAFQNLDKNEESKNLYKEFISTQNEFMELMNTGQEPNEEAMAKFQELQTKLVADENVSALIHAQQRLQITMEDIQKTIFKPLEELFTKYEK